MAHKRRIAVVRGGSEARHEAPLAMRILRARFCTSGSVECAVWRNGARSLFSKFAAHAASPSALSQSSHSPCRSSASVAATRCSGSLAPSWRIKAGTSVSPADSEKEGAIPAKVRNADKRHCLCSGVFTLRTRTLKSKSRAQCFQKNEYSPARDKMAWIHPRSDSNSNSAASRSVCS